MAFALHDLPGGQPIAESSSTKKHALGTRVRATDPTYGEAEFVYLKGVASTVVGSHVVIQSGFGTVLTTLTTYGNVAVAMSANDATTKYGWYAVAGIVPGKAAATVVADAQAQLTATAGEVDDLAVAEKYIRGETFAGTTSGGLALVCLNHPHTSAG